MERQVSRRVKSRRRDEAMAVQQEISRAKNQSFVGRELDVLIEGAGDGVSVGRSYRDAPEVDGVVIVNGELKVGQFARVRITQAIEYDLMAEPVVSKLD